MDKSPAALPPVRRIVCGVNAQGRSVIVEDGSPPAIRRGPARPGFDLRNLWVTTETPARIDQPDRIDEFPGFMPPQNGTVIKYIDFPPEPRDAGAKASLDQETRKRMADVPVEPGMRRHLDGRHSGMHETDTIDYAVVLSGEIYAVLDEGEALMRAGDVLIQCGTSHSWDNRSSEVCRVLFVMIDAVR